MVTYGSRPAAINAIAHNHEIPEMTPDFMTAHLWAAAYFLEMYPEREIYFLGRDAEQLHDVAVLLERHDPGRRARLHLINVSRGHRDDAHLGDYLRQEGLGSPLSKPVLIVDTGNTDKIVNSILGELDPADQGKIVAHYLHSSVEWIPSVRTFASWHDRPEPGSANDLIFMYPRVFSQGYEGDLLHATETSGRYEFVAGKWEAVSEAKPNGFRAKHAQEKWAWWLSQPAIDHEARALRAEFRALHDESKAGDTKAVMDRLHAFIKRLPEQLGQAFLYDYFEMRRKTHPEWAGYVGAADFGVPKEYFSGENDLARLGENEIRARLNGAKDRACFEAVKFFKAPGGQRFERELIALFERCGPSAQNYAAEYVFNRAESVPLRAALNWLIKHGSEEALKKLVEEAFSRPHARAWTAEATLLMHRVVALAATTELERKSVTYVFQTRNVVPFRQALEYGLTHGSDHFVAECSRIWEKPWAKNLGPLKLIAEARLESARIRAAEPSAPNGTAPVVKPPLGGFTKIRHWCEKAISF